MAQRRLSRPDSSREMEGLMHEQEGVGFIKRAHLRRVLKKPFPDGREFDKAIKEWEVRTKIAAGEMDPPKKEKTEDEKQAEREREQKLKGVLSDWRAVDDAIKVSGKVGYTGGAPRVNGWGGHHNSWTHDCGIVVHKRALDEVRYVVACLGGERSDHKSYGVMSDVLCRVVLDLDDLIWSHNGLA